MAIGRKTGGRQKGTPNKKTIAKREALEQASAALGWFEGDAHALLIALYKDPKIPPDIRLDAAKAAVRFEKPTMATTSIDLSVSQKPTVEWSDDELRRFIANERARQLNAPGAQPIDVTPDCVKNPLPKSNS